VNCGLGALCRAICSRSIDEKKKPKCQHQPRRNAKGFFFAKGFFYAKGFFQTAKGFFQTAKGFLFKPLKAFFR
jgi:hypothetical protein